MTARMTENTPSESTGSDLIRQEAELIEAGLALQTDGLRLLLAEMQGLAALIPQVTPVHAPDASQNAPTEAEIEAGFDNMPV